MDGGYFFPDYPKYSALDRQPMFMTTRDFGASMAATALASTRSRRTRCLNGQPARAGVQFFLDSDSPVPLELIGDGLLPADIDGKQKAE